MTSELSVFERALGDKSALDHIMNFAKTISQSDLVPDGFKGKPQNCLLALNYAATMKINYLTVMQSMYVVHGRYGFYTSFLIGLANDSEYFDGPIYFEHEGSGKDLVVYAKNTVKGKEVQAKVSMAMAEAEGWSKKNPKYRSMPEHMLEYRAATFLIRKYAPQILMGTHTKEEIEDMPAEKLKDIEESSALKQIKEVSQNEPEVVDANFEEDQKNEPEQQVSQNNEPLYLGTEDEQRGFNEAMTKAGVPSDRLQEAHEAMIGQPKSYYKELIKEYTGNEP